MSTNKVAHRCMIITNFEGLGRNTHTAEFSVPVSEKDHKNAVETVTKTLGYDRDDYQFDLVKRALIHAVQNKKEVDTEWFSILNALFAHGTKSLTDWIAYVEVSYDESLSFAFYRQMNRADFDRVSLDAELILASLSVQMLQQVAPNEEAFAGNHLLAKKFTPDRLRKLSQGMWPTKPIPDRLARNGLISLRPERVKRFYDPLRGVERQERPKAMVIISDETQREVIEVDLDSEHTNEQYEAAVRDIRAVGALPDNENFSDTELAIYMLSDICFGGWQENTCEKDREFLKKLAALYVARHFPNTENSEPSYAVVIEVDRNDRTKLLISTIPMSQWQAFVEYVNSLDDQPA